jgi:hypothetical protein
MPQLPSAMQDRDDISRFIIHLTRDDRGTFGDGGSPARENFVKILDAKEIYAIRPHCLHGRKLPDEFEHLFCVSCFTECPLSQIEKMVRPMRRQIQLEAYGLVFEREFVMENGGHPATYFNGYIDNDPVREAYDLLFNDAMKNRFIGRRWKMLPFVNTMQNGYDFAWEREWRIRGSLPFELTDVKFAIVPEDVDLEIKKKLGALAIPMYTPGWNMERTMLEAANQQRRVKRLAAPPKPLVKPAKPINLGLR